MKAPRPEIVNTTHSIPPTPTPTPRKYISVVIERKLRNRCGGRCEYVSPEQQRCKSAYGLELDHVIPLALGGSNDESNLRYLCRTHNLHQAVNSLGSVMKNYVPSLK